MSGIVFDRARSGPDPRWGTIGELVAEAAERYGDREFLRFPGVSLTFVEVHVASNRLAVLAAHEVQPGDRVAIMLGNVPEWALSWFAIGKAGAIAVPVNARYQESDLRFVLADSQPPGPRDRDHVMRLVLCSGIVPDLHRRFEERWGVPWRELYGSTESGLDLAVPPGAWDSVGTGAMGQPPPGKQVRIADEADATLPDG